MPFQISEQNCSEKALRPFPFKCQYREDIQNESNIQSCVIQKSRPINWSSNDYSDSLEHLDICTIAMLGTRNLDYDCVKTYHEYIK